MNRRKQNLIFGRLKEQLPLPTLPHLLLRLLEVCNQEEIDTGKLAWHIEKDPALTYKTLELSRSTCLIQPGPFPRGVSVEQALVRLGEDTVRRMIFNASVQELYESRHYAPKRSSPQGFQFNLKRLWHHSLMCALLSRIMAQKLRCANVEEAYLAGLLHDIGKMVLWVNVPEEYAAALSAQLGEGSGPLTTEMLLAAEAKLGALHSQVGATMIRTWSHGSLLTDAVLYHHEPVQRIVHAFPLIKLVHVANALCSESYQERYRGLEAADMVFGFRETEVKSFIARAKADLLEAARYFNLPLKSDSEFDTNSKSQDSKKRQQLNAEIRDTSLLLGSFWGITRAQGEQGIINTLHRTLEGLFGFRNSLYFACDQERDLLIWQGGRTADNLIEDSLITDNLVKDNTGSRTVDGFTADGLTEDSYAEESFTAGSLAEKRTEGGALFSMELLIPLHDSPSLLLRSLVEGAPLNSFDAYPDGSPPLVDEQMIRLLGREGIIGLPLLARGIKIGILVLGLNRSDLPLIKKREQRIMSVVKELGLALYGERVRKMRAERIQSERFSASSSGITRKIVHEASNPLGIMKNYLKILERKLKKEKLVMKEIPIINEEIERVMRLLEELSQLSNQKEEEFQRVEVNTLVEDLLALSAETLFQPAKIEVHRRFSKTLPPVMMKKDSLKQILVNLITNAVEAMTGGGTLMITTRYWRSISLREMPDLPVIAGRSRAYFQIEVEDDGPGIPDPIRLKLFKPFFSTKGDTHQGLGLSIVYSLVKSLRGFITCRSSRESGTSFCLTFPVEN